MAKGNAGAAGKTCLDHPFNWTLLLKMQALDQAGILLFVRTHQSTVILHCFCRAQCQGVWTLR